MDGFNGTLDFKCRCVDFYLENEDVYLLKKFDYERIEKVEQKVSILSMTKKIDFTS